MVKGKFLNEFLRNKFPKTLLIDVWLRYFKCHISLWMGTKKV